MSGKISVLIAAFLMLPLFASTSFAKSKCDSDYRYSSRRHYDEPKVVVVKHTPKKKKLKKRIKKALKRAVADIVFDKPKRKYRRRHRNQYEPTHTRTTVWVPGHWDHYDGYKVWHKGYWKVKYVPRQVRCEPAPRRTYYQSCSTRSHRY